MKILLVVLIALMQEAVPPAAPAPADEEFAKEVFFGRKFFDLKDYAAAYEHFEKAEAIRRDHPAMLYNMALVLAKAGRYSDAQVKVDRYNQLHPAGAEKPLVTKLQYELEFQREVQKKRQADQDYLELFNRAKFLYGKNDLDAALKLFQEAERLRPQDPASVFNQAAIHQKQGDLPKAAQRFRRFGELERNDEEKAGLDQKLFALDSEIEDMRTKIVCSFCGHKLHDGATWCHRCWHGPYLTKSAVWNTRPCADGASATRATYYSDGRFAKNDALPCVLPGKSALEALRYTPERQRAIQSARKAEGWTYDGDVIQGWADRTGNQIRYVQAAYLEKIVAANGGETLTFSAKEVSPGVWLLDREDIVIDGIRYRNQYTFDSTGRIAQQRVEYQNTAACNHVISSVADFTYQNDRLVSVKLAGGYDGFTAEGSPKTEWQAAVGYSYDDQARVAKEELVVTQFDKTYAQKPVGAIRDEVGRIYGGMRVKKPVENVTRIGDICASGLINPIDLRPFYAMSPNLGIALPPGVNKATVTFVYP